MDKKTLRSIPRPEADPSYYRMAKEVDKASPKWLVRASVEGDVLQVIAWEIKDLKKEIPGASLRLFFGDDDFITQDLKETKTKWYTGKAYSVLKLYWWNVSPENQIMYADDESRKLLADRFPYKGYGRSNRSPWENIDEWQNKVLDKRLADKHYRQLAPVRAMMELVPEIPEGFEEFVHDQVMRKHRYLVYDGNSSIRKRSAFCTECGKHMVIDSKAVRLRIGEWGECPCCGSPVMMWTFKRWHSNENAFENAAIFQKLEGGMILARVFRCAYCFQKEGDNEAPWAIRIRREEYVTELCRVFMDGYKWQSYEYAEYKQSGKTCWCPDMGVTNTNYAIVWTKGLRETLAGTPYRYSGLEAFQDNEPFEQLPIFRFLRTYERRPEIEMVAKAGLVRLAAEVSDSYYCNSKSLDDLKKLDKQQLQIMRRLNGGCGMVSLLRDIGISRLKMSEAEIVEYVDAFGTGTSLIRRLMDMNIRPHKFVKWALKQTGSRKPGDERKRKMRNLYHDWDDYLSWCRELHYDLKDMYVVMPPDFKKAHDRVMAEVQRKKDEAMRKQREKTARELKKLMDELRGMDPLHLRSKKFMIVLPSSVNDLKKEGTTLHHCVATYADRVAKGETLILFIRQISEPDTPFYTMEWRDNRVIQCRGSHNKDMTPDVKTFVTAFEKRMQETAAAG